MTRDAYAVAAEVAEGTDDSVGWALDDKSSARLTGISKLLQGDDRAELARRLELLASVHFLVDRGQVPRNDAKQVAETLNRFGKDYRKGEIEDAMEELSKHALFPRSAS